MDKEQKSCQKTGDCRETNPYIYYNLMYNITKEAFERYGQLAAFFNYLGFNCGIVLFYSSKIKL